MSKHQVEHMEFDVSYDKRDGAWFSLRVPGQKAALFSGPINVGMAGQVFKLHKAIKDIELKIAAQCNHCDGSGWIETEKMVRVSGEYQAFEPIGQQERCEHCNPLGV